MANSNWSCSEADTSFITCTSQYLWPGTISLSNNYMIMIMSTTKTAMTMIKVIMCPWICMYHHILPVAVYLFREGWLLVFATAMQSMMCAKGSIDFNSNVVFTRWYNYAISLSSLNKFGRKQWKYNMLYRWLQSSVSKMGAVISNIIHAIYSLHISALIIVKILVFHIKCQFEGRSPPIPKIGVIS